MSTIKAIVYPIVTGRDYCEAAPPLCLSADSKAAAIRALRAAGYRIMWVGGEIGNVRVRACDLRGTRGGDARVVEAERDIGYALDADAEITAYSVTVWPKR